jgi:predicted SAM-dependent methyltransferase
VSREHQAAVAALAERVGPAVVGFGRGWGRGSGVVVAPGRVVTNAHNLRGGADVMVSFADGRRVNGLVSETDPDLDVAVVRVDTGEVQPVEHRPSPAGPEVGAPVVALANRGGRGLRTMVGSVSATDMQIRGPRGRTIRGCIAHDAPLPRGSGGGPLVDLDGRLLGLNALRLEDGQIVAIRSGGDGARAERLGTAREPGAQVGVPLGMEQAHPLFERLEVLADDPPHSRALMERLGLPGIHVGCGPNVPRGWLNTDRNAFADASGTVSPLGRIVRGTAGEDRDRYFLSHDALDPYPFEDGAFDFAYAEHFIEHISRDAAIAWLREIHRLLTPGGFLRLSTPNLRRYVDGYVDPAESFFAEHRKMLLNMPLFGERGVPETRGFMVNHIFRFFGHQWIYDLDEMRAVAAGAGFDPAAVTDCSFQEGRLPEVAGMDQAEHSDESLYVEIART